MNCPQMIYFATVLVIGGFLMHFLNKTMDYATGSYEKNGEGRLSKKEETKAAWRYWARSMATLVVFVILVQCVRFVV